MNTRLCFRDSVSAVHTTEYDTRSLFIKFMVTERSCVCVCVWLCEFVCENLRDATQSHTQAQSSDFRDDSVPDATPCTREQHGKGNGTNIPHSVSLRLAKQVSCRHGSLSFSNVQSFACDLMLTVR